jgi:hypothetical protein
MMQLPLLWQTMSQLEKVAKKIRNAHIESRANSTTVSTITNFFLPQKK